jgi:hypothetical protein
VFSPQQPGEPSALSAQRETGYTVKIDIDKLVEAGQDGVRRHLCEELGKVDLGHEHFLTFFRDLTPESDRAVAVIVFAYVDEQLRVLMERACNPDIAGGCKSLFEGFGPLASAGARIQLAAALFWLSPLSYKNLRLMRKIRNEFAHSTAARSFSDSAISGLVTNMERLEEAVIAASPEEFRPETERKPRDLFIVRSALTCAHMMSEVAVAPAAIRAGLYPHEPLRHGYAELPQSVKELTRSAMTVLAELLGRDT